MDQRTSAPLAATGSFAGSWRRSLFAQGLGCALWVILDREDPRMRRFRTDSCEPVLAGLREGVD